MPVLELSIIPIIIIEVIFLSKKLELADHSVFKITTISNLVENWEAVMKRKPLSKIEPLE